MRPAARHIITHKATEQQALKGLIPGDLRCPPLDFLSPHLWTSILEQEHPERH